ncbi:protein arginine N-methyltransferase 6 [Macrosteles quadrilineatus]|uniref:protein arginine N-methyltransferase 6 n=1 Tax=Macrosteles quadrilineatus TaxID=74068 RepID=UPI0023E2001A|nr:protein arginine N-methyltransferase 6 [Macrosteles quadrilineatus]
MVLEGRMDGSSSQIQYGSNLSSHNPCYFSSYGDLKVHELMLKDKTRTEFYKNVIFSNKEVFQDKIVMDVGTGTGILSIFCAQAGAKKVYAIERSEIAKLATDIVKENNLSNVIEVIQEQVENVVLPCKVDVMISEWMGFYLLHEGMLDSILAARDKHLKEGGLMFPYKGIIYSAPCQLPEYFELWDKFHGVKMSTLGQALRKGCQGEPQITRVAASDLLSEGKEVAILDFNRTSCEELNKISVRQFVAVNKQGNYQGVCLWFTVEFPSVNGKEGMVLSTSPLSEPTHWKQTVIVLPVHVEVEEKDPVAWELVLERNQMNHRMYNIHLTMLDPETETHPMPCDCSFMKCKVIKAFLEQQNNEEDMDEIIDCTTTDDND